MASFAALVGSQDFSGAVRLLDAEIDGTRASYEAAMHRLVQLHVNRGICNQRLQLNRKALKDFDAALELNPSSVKALLHKGQVLLSLGRAGDAREAWERASTLSDPSADLDTLLQVNQALEGVGGTPATSSAPAPAAAAAAPPAAAAVATGATPGLAQVPHDSLEQSSAGVAAAPQPQKKAEAGIAAPHENGVIGAGHTSVSSPWGAAGSSSSSAAKQPAAAAAASVKADGAKPAAKAFKGFLKPVPGSSSTSSSGSKGPSASTPAAAAGRSSSSAGDAVDIDCAAQQQRQLKQQRVGPVSFGEQVAQQQSSSLTLTMAINQINAGQLQAAEAALDKLLAAEPHNLSALVARGTARALNRDLKRAVDDFTAAIKIEPRYPDVYKRRGQARSALNDLQGAYDDVSRAAQLLEAAESEGMGALLRAQGDDRNTAADCYAECGMLLQKMKDYRRAVKDLGKAAKADPNNPQVWNFLGLARVSMGDIREGCEAYRKALQLAPDMLEAWLNLGQACKEEARVDEADRALTKALKNADGTPCLPAYRLLATMRQGAGRQAEAVKLIDKALSFKKDSVELLYLRAICHHALGYVRKAVADYESCMHLPLRTELEGPLAEEARMYQYLCYYQREIALWMGHNLDTRAGDICLDTELAPAFKEGWCKKCFPDQKIFQTHTAQPPLPDDTSNTSSSSNSSGKRGSSAATSPRTSSSSSSGTGPSSSSSSSTSPKGGAGTSSSSSGSGIGVGVGVEAAVVGGSAKQVAALTAAADTLGNLLQNHHQGFLPNIRQQRAAGYAALQLAQTVRSLLAERQAGREGLWVNSEGSSGEGGCSGRHLFGWRDAMDILVKWRQLSEPADQVVWVDLLTKEEFENGFGSHTPMYSGQTKCVRYFMNHARAMELAKDCLVKLGHAYDAQNREVPLGGDHKREAVRGAKTALDLYRVIGQDSWVVVPLHSILKHQHKAANSSSSSSSGTAAAASTANGNSKPATAPAPSTASSSSSSSKAASSAGKAAKTTSSSSSSSGGRSGVRGRGVQPVVVPEGCLEGTRLTLVNVPNQPDAVEFSIRTPVTPPRWKEFDAELEAGWEAIIGALLTGDKRAIATAIMCYAYYWYNFMPLARGTAAVGYTTMLGLFWAAGMPISQTIPQDYQVDWEAILATHPQQFISRLSEWFVPQAALPCAPIPNGSSSSSSGDSGSNGVEEAPASPAPNGSSSSSSSGGVGEGGGAVLPVVDSLPRVDEVLATFRQRLNALNGPNATPV